MRVNVGVELEGEVVKVETMNILGFPGYPTSAALAMPGTKCELKRPGLAAWLLDQHQGTSVSQGWAIAQGDAPSFVRVPNARTRAFPSAQERSP